MVDVVVGHVVQPRFFRHRLHDLTAEHTDAQRDCQTQCHHRQDGGGEGTGYLVHVVAADGLRADGIGTEAYQESHAVEDLNQRKYQVDGRDCVLSDDMTDNHGVCRVC